MAYLLISFNWPMAMPHEYKLLAQECPFISHKGWQRICLWMMMMMMIERVSSEFDSCESDCVWNLKIADTLTYRIGENPLSATPKAIYIRLRPLKWVLPLWSRAPSPRRRAHCRRSRDRQSFTPRQHPTRCYGDKSSILPLLIGSLLLEFNFMFAWNAPTIY